jgi:hypothetical protein
MLDEIITSQQFAEFGPEHIIADRDDHELAVFGFKALEWRDRGMRTPERDRYLLLYGISHYRVFEGIHKSVYHRYIDVLSLAGLVSILECRQDSYRSLVPSHDIPDRRADSDRRTSQRAGYAHEA